MDDAGGLGRGLRLILTALASAALTATLVIAVGRTVIDHGPAPSAPLAASLVRVAH